MPCSEGGEMEVPTDYLIHYDKCHKRFRSGNQKRYYILILKFSAKTIISIAFRALGSFH